MNQIQELVLQLNAMEEVLGDRHRLQLQVPGAIYDIKTVRVIREGGVATVYIVGH